MKGIKFKVLTVEWEREKKNDYTFFIKLSTDFVFIQIGMCTDGAPVNVNPILHGGG